MKHLCATTTTPVALALVGALLCVAPGEGYASADGVSAGEDPPVLERAMPEDAEQTTVVQMGSEPSANQDDSTQVPGPDESEPQRYDVSYVDEFCESRIAQACAPLDATCNTLKGGWYVLREDVTLTEALVVEGDVRLILENGHTLATDAGVRVKKDAKLTLYGGEDAPGRLVVRKGIMRWLTPEQQEEERAAQERELAANPDYKPEEPRILFVQPCLEVTAGDHEPRPDDANDPDHAPKRVEKPQLRASLLSRDYLDIRPLLSHAMQEGEDGPAQTNGHFTCLQCTAWFADVDGHEPVDKGAAGDTLVTDLSETGAKMVTVTFDADGGSGSMDPIEVPAGEGFVLPECTFEPPEGKEFSSWSLGKPGSTVSVPTSTTVKAWWKNAKTTNTGGSGGSGSNTSGTSETPSSEGDNASQSSSTTPTTSSGAQTSANATTSAGTTNMSSAQGTLSGSSSTGTQGAQGGGNGASTVQSQTGDKAATPTLGDVTDAEQAQMAAAALAGAAILALGRSRKRTQADE